MQLGKILKIYLRWTCLSLVGGGGFSTTPLINAVERSHMLEINPNFIKNPQYSLQTSRNVKLKLTIVMMTLIARTQMDRSSARVSRDILEMELRVMVSNIFLNADSHRTVASTKPFKLLEKLFEKSFGVKYNRLSFYKHLQKCPLPQQQRFPLNCQARLLSL